MEKIYGNVITDSEMMIMSKLLHCRDSSSFSFEEAIFSKSLPSPFPKPESSELSSSVLARLDNSCTVLPFSPFEVWAT